MTIKWLTSDPIF